MCKRGRERHTKTKIISQIERQIHKLKEINKKSNQRASKRIPTP